MADEGNVTSNLNLDADTLPAAGVISQYVKDLSVENPNAPDCYAWADTPEMDVQFNIAAHPLQGEVHEVELKIKLTAKAEAGVAYLVDLTYAGLVGMRNLDEANMHAFMFAEAPRILFPFARRVVADAVRDAGFQPLLLEPIDFNGIYLQQLAAQAQQADGADALGEPAGHA
ncbi:MAG TPA: protein-export chaperone SecB [Novosphingobium sp.]|nr:protein-export chaperone SecB [Novosphingobium sp.]